MARCGSCGQQNPEGFRFCGNCATPLPVVPAGGREERKIVSVLFCDLVGFTTRSERADPEDVRATLRAYHDSVRREIERFEGTVEKFIGDAVMAVFGAPVAHDDDPERAVRAALRVIQALTEINRERPELDLTVRIGVNTGEAVVALGARPDLGEGMVAGDVVNTAARLQQVGQPGTVVVGEMTYRASRDAVEFEPLEPVSLKGKAEPVPAWQAVSVRSRAGVDVEQRAAAPLVGRSRELALMENLFIRALEESSVQLMTISGEPGVGKSRLVWEFHKLVDERPEPVSWRQGRCLPYGDGITFWALGEIVKAQAGVLDTDPPEEAARKLGEAVDAAADDPSQRSWMRSRLLPLLGLRPEAGGTTERAESFAAWRGFLEGVAAQGPMVLVFEDVHWADAAMLEFVEHLVAWSTGVSIVLVCTARPELFERKPGWGGGTGNSATIALSPLSPDDTARLVSALLSEALLPAETQAALIERSGGNPLYAEEFVRMLVDRGVLVRRGRVATIAEGAEIPLPESVQGIISARLDTLAPDRKAMLQDAAVVGKVFWSGTLVSMDGRDEAQVRDGLHELARKELVRPARRASMEGQAEYSFWHILIRDVAYGQIPRAARAAKHRGVAEWIEAIAGDRVGDHAELLAYHYERSLELARAAGASDIAELEERARRFLVLAGDRAINLDISRAVSYYGRALPMFGSDDPLRGETRAMRAEATFLAGSIIEAVAEYETAVEELRRAGEDLRAAVALSRLAFVYRWRAAADQAEAATSEASRLVEAQPPSADVVQVHLQVTTSHMLAGRAHQCLEWSERTLEMARRFGKPEQIQRALQLRGIARGGLGDYGGTDDLRAAVGICVELGLGQDTYRAKGNLADYLWVVEGPQSGLDTMREGVEWARSHGITAGFYWGTAESLWMLFDLGRWDEMLLLEQEIVAWADRFGGRYMDTVAKSYAAQVLVWQGQVEEASSRIDRFLPLAREIRDPQVLSPALAIAAIVRRAKGNVAEAMMLVQELTNLVLASEFAFFNFFHLTDVARICAAAGDLKPVERLLGRLVPNARREHHGVLTARAVVAEANGSVEEAAELYAEAAEAWREFPSVLEEGLALVGAARCRLARGERAEDELRMARAVLLGLGAPGPLEEADELLRRSIAQTS
ncbi:MAG TPA: adenylate/guanylate cyclase domain-containing protein [Actinomycetota bacterium]